MQGSISSTFNLRVFRTKAHFWHQNFERKRFAQLCNFWRQNFAQKTHAQNVDEIDYRSQMYKKDSQVSCIVLRFFVLLGSMSLKAFGKMLMKSTTSVSLNTFSINFPSTIIHLKTLTLNLNWFLKFNCKFI